MKGCALPQLAFGGHSSAMPLDNLFADGKTDASSFEIPSAVESVKYFEDLFGILRIEPDPVVRHRNVVKVLGALQAGNKVARGHLRLEKNARGTVCF